MAKPGKPRTDEEIWDAGEPDDDVWARGVAEPMTEPPTQDWGDATRSGMSVVQPAPGPESIAPEPFGPRNVEVGPGEALALAYLSGVVKQGADEATGATAAALYGGDGTTGDIYRGTRDRMRERMAAAQAQHPWLTFGAGMAGDMSSDYLLKLMGAPVTSQPYQTAMGGFSGFMGSDADLTTGAAKDYLQAGTDAAKGTALGYTAPIVGRWIGKGVGKGAGWVGEKLDDTWVGRWGEAARNYLADKARERALKASGYIQKDFPQDPVKRARLLDRGQRLLDEPGLITPGATAETIGERLQTMKADAGEAIGSTLRKVDEGTGDLMLDQMLEGHSFNPYTFIDKAKTEILDAAEMDPALRQQARAIRTLLNGYRDTAEQLALEGKPWTFQMANEMKGNLQDAIFNNRGDVAKNKQLANDLQRLFIQEIDSQVENIAGEGERAAFQLARQRYGDATDALKKATQGANRDTGNNFLGLGDRAAGEVAAAAGGGIPGAALAAGLSKMFRGRGDSTAARAADWMSQGDWLDDLAKTNPEALGKWGQYLGAAASRSADALSEAKYDLGQTDAEYQQARRRQGEQEQ